jgi:hypothetical protein
MTDDLSGSSCSGRLAACSGTTLAPGGPDAGIGKQLRLTPGPPPQRSGTKTKPPDKYELFLHRMIAALTAAGLTKAACQEKSALAWLRKRTPRVHARGYTRAPVPLDRALAARGHHSTARAAYVPDRYEIPV